MKTLSEILTKIDGLPKEADRAATLATMPDPYPRALKILIKHALDPNIKHRDIFGEISYDKCRDDNPGALLYETKRLYLLIEGNAPGLDDAKLKAVFERMLSTLIPEDAELMLSVMRKKFPYKKIDRKIIKRAFPGLL